MVRVTRVGTYCVCVCVYVLHMNSSLKNITVVVQIYLVSFEKILVKNHGSNVRFY